MLRCCPGDRAGASTRRDRVHSVWTDVDAIFAQVLRKPPHALRRHTPRLESRPRPSVRPSTTAADSPVTAPPAASRRHPIACHCCCHSAVAAVSACRKPPPCRAAATAVVAAALASAIPPVPSRTFPLQPSLPSHCLRRLPAPSFHLVGAYLGIDNGNGTVSFQQLYRFVSAQSKARVGYGLPPLPRWLCGSRGEVRLACCPDHSVIRPHDGKMTDWNPGRGQEPGGGAGEQVVGAGRGKRGAEGGEQSASAGPAQNILVVVCTLPVAFTAGLAIRLLRPCPSQHLNVTARRLLRLLNSSCPNLWSILYPVLFY